jgi:hypothetical protein
MLGFRLNKLEIPRDVSIFIKHSCNKDNIMDSKIVKFVVQAAEKYPSRVWEAVNPAISLDENEEDFIELREKIDQ